MEYLLISVLLLIAAETTYLVVVSNKRLQSNKKAQIFVDTSVLIDGRIIAIAEAGFIPGRLVVPRSVINELQLLADQGDHEKRTRARHGLDVLTKLQSFSEVEVTLLTDKKPYDGVDRHLLELAKRFQGMVCTIDYNLIKVAQVEKVAVLNINDLAKNLRMEYLPGEKAMIELKQKGNDSHQAVGHLADGSMVVVEQASNLIGQIVEVEFIRSLQTAAGRMMFAKLTGTGVGHDALKKHPKPSGKHPITQQSNSTSAIKSKPGQQRKSNEDRMVELANR